MTRRDVIKRVMIVGLGCLVHTALVADTKTSRRDALVALRKKYKKAAFAAKVAGDAELFKKFDDLQFNIKVQINREAGCKISKYRVNEIKYG